jgi:hypothetical protein
MRIAGLLVCLVFVGLVGCKGGDGEASPTADPAALKAQRELTERRDALMAQRKKLESDRDQLDARIKEVTAQGGDTSELAKQRAVLDTALESSGSDLASISSKIDQVVAQGDARAGLAGREAQMATRERQVATREGQFAERERALAAREAELAKRERDTCGAGVPTIVQVAAPKGANYSRREIDPLLGKARAMIAKKGLLPGDLGPAAGLEGEATAAMKAEDWGKAYLAAAQLLATVDTIRVDRNFISGKTARLQAQVRSARRDDAVQAQLADGMRDVMQRFGDGDFAAANKRLNQLWSLVSR